MALINTIATACRNKIFLSGVAVKVFLILFFFPEIQEQWFISFVTNVIENPSLTPWQSYLNNGGDISAFPYGPVMLIVHLPFVFCGWILDSLFVTQVFSLIGFKFSLFFADLTILLVLVRMYPSHYRKILIYYWLSPIVIYITYIHGQSDIIPVCLLTVSLYFLQQMKIKHSAIVMGAAIAAKFSMIIALPFLYLYLIINKKYKCFHFQFIYILVATTIALQIPFILDGAFYEMVLDNEKLQRIYWMKIAFYDNIVIYVTPLILLFAIYFLWRQSKISFDLLMAIITAGFLSIILASSPPPGWFVWLAPLFALHQVRHGTAAIQLISLFSAILIVFYFLTSTSGHFLPFNWDVEILQTYILTYVSNKNLSLLYTGLAGLGLIIVLQVTQSGIKRNRYLLFNNKTFSIGISGGVASGKSTLSNAIEELFGTHSVCRLSGNDYTIWNRHSPMWKTITPLNPQANSLMDFTNDVNKLIQRKDISCCLYNTKSGYFSKLQNLKSNDMVIVSGFHALFSQHLRNQLDLKIFLDIDTSLKHHYRGCNKPMLELHDKDCKQYIDRQKQYADIMFTLKPLSNELISQNLSARPLSKLRITIQHGIYFVELQRAFIGLCNLHVDLQHNEEMDSAILEIDGELDFKGEDAFLAIKMICPNLLEILDVKPKWHDGMLGIMQVVVLAAINQALQEHE